MSKGKRSVTLGPRHRRVPANVPARTNKKAFKTALALLRGDAAPVVVRVEERVNHVEGRNRQLQVDVLLAAAIASAREGVMEPRRASALLHGLGSSTQIDCGIRVVKVHGADVVSEGQVRYLFDQIAKAFLPDGASHDHPVVDGEHVVNPATGEIVAPADTLTVEQLVACECTSACPAALSAEHLGNELIGATWSHFGIPDTSTWAVDSYLLVSHYSPRSWGDAATMEFPDEPAAMTRTPAPGQPKAKAGKPRGGRKPSAGTKAAAVNAHNDWANTQPDAPLQPNSSRKRPPAGPTAVGDFTRLDREFPQIGADGRLVHTVDPDARNGFRGAGRSRRTEIANGRDKHALVASGLFPDGTPFPAFVRAYCLTPGGGDKTAACLSAVDHARSGGAAVVELSLDRGYTNEPAVNLLAPMIERGVRLVMDHKQHQHRTRLHAPGVLEIDGNFYTDATPVGLRELPAHAKNTSTRARRELSARYDQRAVYMFRPNGTTDTGRPRFRGPAMPDRLVRNRAGTVTKTAGVKVSCPNSKYQHLAPASAPETGCEPGVPCGCVKTFSVPVIQLPGTYQTPAYGTSTWLVDYHRRNLVETFNSFEQYHRRVGRHSIKVLPPRYDLAHALLTVGLLIDAIYSFVMRLGARDIDTSMYDFMDPVVTRACFARVTQEAPADTS